MHSGGRSGASVALVDFSGVRQMFFCGVAQVLRFVQKDNWFERAFSKFEERTLAALLGRSEERGCLPGRGWRLCCADQRGYVPFGERQERGALDRRDGALRARVKFAHRLDGVSQKLDSYRARCFGGKYVHDAAAHGELAG